MLLRGGLRAIHELLMILSRYANDTLWGSCPGKILELFVALQYRNKP